MIKFWELPESRRLEFKERFPRGDQVARTAIAFANGAGGRIVFGVRNDPRVTTGISDKEIFALEEQVTSHIFDKCSPDIMPEVFIQSVEGKNLLVLEIYPGPNKPYYLKSAGLPGGCYIRVGSTNRLASDEMIRDLERRRQNLSFDSLPHYDIDVKALRLDKFKKDYQKATGRKLDNERLKNLGLFKAERNRLYATNAALLLSDNPQQVFPYAKIECARFKGTQRRVFLDQSTITGPIYAAIEECMAFIKKNIALSSSIGEVYRTDTWEYPLDAIREALANAVIHRDYSVLGSDTKVAIYDDMLEITSPGTLPDIITLDILGTGRSEIRNRVLAPIFKDLKLIEAWGTGISKMQDDVSNYPGIELIFNEPGHAFQVQFVRRPAGQGPDKLRTSYGQAPDKPRTTVLRDPDMMKILAFCRQRRTIKEIMGHIGKRHRETFLNNYLQPLMAAGFIAMTIPDKPKSPKQQYSLTNEGLSLLPDASPEGKSPR
jgi:predicted HTH transcriptional regulator